jgi:hypothetical protein
MGLSNGFSNNGSTVKKYNNTNGGGPTRDNLKSKESSRASDS